MRMSKVSLLESGTRAEQRDPVSLVYEALRDDAQRSGKSTYTWADLNTLLGHKFSVRGPSPLRQAAIRRCRVNSQEQATARKTRGCLSTKSTRDRSPTIPKAVNAAIFEMQGFSCRIKLLRFSWRPDMLAMLLPTWLMTHMQASAVRRFKHCPSTGCCPSCVHALVSPGLCGLAARGAEASSGSCTDRSSQA